METLLIDREFAAPAAVITALLDAGCEVRGDAAVRAIDGRVKAAEDADWDTEYLDTILYARVVDGLSEIVRALVRTPVTNAHLVTRLLLETKMNQNKSTRIQC